MDNKNKEEKTLERKKINEEEKKKSEEEIDEELEQTFPASDPPSFSKPHDYEEE